MGAIISIILLTTLALLILISIAYLKRTKTFTTAIIVAIILMSVITTLSIMFDYARDYETEYSKREIESFLVKCYSPDVINVAKDYNAKQILKYDPKWNNKFFRFKIEDGEPDLIDLEYYKVRNEK